MPAYNIGSTTIVILSSCLQQQPSESSTHTSSCLPTTFSNQVLIVFHACNNNLGQVFILDQVLILLHANNILSRVVSYFFIQHSESSTHSAYNKLLDQVVILLQTNNILDQVLIFSHAYNNILGQVFIILHSTSSRALCRTNLLPVTHVLVDTWMLTDKPVYKLSKCV